MTNLDIIEFIDEFLSEQEDVLHGIEGRDCTKSRKYLDMIKKQLTIPRVSQRSELLAFAKEMQRIGFNEMDDAEKVVDIYLKANCG